MSVFSFLHMNSCRCLCYTNTKALTAGSTWAASAQTTLRSEGDSGGDTRTGQGIKQLNICSQTWWHRAQRNGSCSSTELVKSLWSWEFCLWKKFEIKRFIFWFIYTTCAVRYGSIVILIFTHTDSSLWVQTLAVFKSSWSQSVSRTSLHTSVEPNRDGAGRRCCGGGLKRKHLLFFTLTVLS